MGAQAPRSRHRRPTAANEEVLAGIHAVTEAIRAGRRIIHSMHIAEGRRDKRVQAVSDQAEAAGISIRLHPGSELDRMAGTRRHQGCCLRASPFPQSSVDAMVSDTAPAFLLVLDQVVDPHNLGALVRSAEAAGVSGVIVPRDRSVGPTPDVSRISVGALEHIQLAAVVNLARTLDGLRKAGVWIVGLDAGTQTSIFDVDLTAPTALVVGAEAKGIRPLVRKHCDVIAAIPLAGQVTSLNASVAGAVAMFETIRQRVNTGSLG